MPEGSDIVRVNLDLAGYKINNLIVRSMEDESIIRQAAKELNESIEEFETNHPDQKGVMAYLIVALDCSVKKIRAERRSEGGASSESLLRMEQDLDEALSI
ncbi:MAG: hypothetical protein J6Y72_08790 [Bacteroidales bacterium]|jgi:Ribonuclease G/E|nr:hypothetical protein [Bacteroidales bacterium]MBP5419888.1 hypothetical protein [Bacteroidales bacterium]MCR5697178.1 hypothetical protein [Marinilabiliaceae bacterium]